MFTLTDNRKIGIMLTGLGLFFMTLGVMLFFDSGLIAIGDILFLASFPFLVGVQRTLELFNPIAKDASWRGIAAFFSGVILVLVRWPMLGMALQVGGLIEMFGSFFWRIVEFLRAMPYIGPVLNMPIIKQVVDFLTGLSAKPSTSKV